MLPKFPKSSEEILKFFWTIGKRKFWIKVILENYRKNTRRKITYKKFWRNYGKILKDERMLIQFCKNTNNLRKILEILPGKNFEGEIFHKLWKSFKKILQIF